MRDLNKIMQRKLMGNCRGLWENREALDKYLKRLKELMESDEQKTYVKKEERPLPNK